MARALFFAARLKIHAISSFIFLLITLILAAPQVAPAQTIVGIAPDPGGYSLGFGRSHWASSIKKALVFFGGTDATGGDNSIRAFDPVTNTWEYLWPKGYMNGGPQQRDNNGSLYVPRLDELWVWGGSHLEVLPGALRSGRFSIAQRKWLSTSTNDVSAFSSAVKNFGGGLIDSGMAWSETLDIGLIFGGWDGGNASDRYWIIEPNTQGPEPYRMSEMTAGLRPKPRAQASNLLVAAGSDFYLFGGYAGSVDGRWTFVTDFWKFDGIKRTWSQLPSPPLVSYQPVLTYDSDKHLILAWVDDHLLAFQINTNQWVDVTPSGLPCVGNHVGVYSPTAKINIYHGGNSCPSGNSANIALGISLAAVVQTPPAPGAIIQPVPPPPSAPVPNPASTLMAVNLGVTGEDKVGQTNPSPNAKADFHVSVSGLRGTPNKVRITSDTGGIWEIPFNGQNWIVATQYDGQGNGHYWFEQAASKTFHVKVTYPDTTTDDADASNQTSTVLPVLPVTPPVVPSPPPATVTNPNPGAQAPLTPEGWVNIPLRTWVSRLLPPHSADVRNQVIGQTGFGPAGPAGSGQAKHQRIVYNPDSKRLYFYSGDYSGPPFSMGFRTDMFSYDLLKTDTGDAQNWRLEWPFCGLTGETSPIHTDETGFAWDSTRKIFWLISGFSSVADDAISGCREAGITGVYYGTNGGSPGNADFPGTHVMQFNPATNRWSAPAKFQPLAWQTNNAVYNPVTDELITMGVNAGGSTIAHLNPTTAQWSYFGAVVDEIDGHYINEARLTHEQLALDVANQHIYSIDTYHSMDPDPNRRFRLLRYNITRHTMADLGWINLPDARVSNPGFCNLDNQYDDVGCTTFPFYVQPRNSTMLGYDPINKVVLWPASSNSGRPILMIYHPDPNGGKNGSWEVDPMTRDKPSEAIFGSNGAFIPELNALVTYGGFSGVGEDLRPAPMSHFWLYRYGNGDGQPYVPVTPPPVVTTPPPPPPPPAVVTPPPASTLKAVNLGVTGEDKVGQPNQTTPNGKADFHISVSGLRSTPNKVTITSNTGGIWETPFNGVNWIIATQYDGQGNGHYWFEQFASQTFRVKVGYVDGTSDAADAASQNAPAVKFSQPNLTFVTQPVGSPKVLQTITLTNSGSAAFDITGINATGDFTQSSNCPSTLSAGAQCVITVAFQPLVQGLRTGFLTVTDNAPGSPHIVNLTGTGTPVAIDTTPPTIVITAPPANAPASKTVRVTLSATDNVGVKTIELYKDGALLGTGTSSGYNYDWDTAKDSNGNHTLIAVAYDMANNRSTATVTINVQNSAAAVAKPPVLGRRF